MFRNSLPLFILLVFSAALAKATPTGDSLTPLPCKTVKVFSRQGCPHCERANKFLRRFQADHPEIIIIEHDIEVYANNLEYFIALNRKYGVTHPGIPSFEVCGQFTVGFDPLTTGAWLKVNLGIAAENPNPTADTVDNEVRLINLPLLGQVEVDQLSLPVLTIIIGLVDGFNPCAMWVLLFLLSLLVNLKSRARILFIAGTFVMVSGLVYFAFMAAWLNLFLLIGISRGLQVAVAVIAMIIGSVHVKDFFAFQHGVSLSVPEAAKPGLYARIRRVIQADNLAAAVMGVIVVALLVNFLELLCTAGLPALYTQILVQRGLSTPQYYSYLGLYNAAYIFDDALMVGIVVFTLSRYKVGEKQGRWLKLISGAVVLILGIVLLFAPEWLF